MPVICVTARPASQAMTKAEPHALPRQARPAAGLVKQSLSIAGHRTSIALEPQFWARLHHAAAARGISAPALVAEIDSRRAPGAALSSAIRVFLLEQALAG
jgi:predicted DNA-binding ribbon-helix-helix protein